MLLVAIGYILRPAEDLLSANSCRIYRCCLYIRPEPATAALKEERRDDKTIDNSYHNNRPLPRFEDQLLQPREIVMEKTLLLKRASAGAAALACATVILMSSLPGRLSAQAQVPALLPAVLHAACTTGPVPLKPGWS